jgi:hypothetical protein
MVQMFNYFSSFRLCSPLAAAIGGANTGLSLVSRPGSFFWEKKYTDLSLPPHANCQTLEPNPSLARAARP